MAQQTTVHGGISEEQLRLEGECDELIRQAKAAVVRGDSEKALDLLLRGWELSQKHEFLKGHRAIIARDRGRVYLDQGKIKLAVDAFKQRLTVENRQCGLKTESAEAARACAEAHMDLGSAQLLLNDNIAALANIRETISCYRLCDKDHVGSSEEVRLVYLEQRGEATLLAGIASHRLGDKKATSAFLAEGTEILEGVKSNPRTPEALRTMATTALQFARQ